MAGDWIKIEHVSPDKPEVFEIAEHAKLEPDEAFGKLMRFWIWADQQFSSGKPEQLSDSKIDFIVRHKGFAKAMRAVGWLVGEGKDCAIPNFERHNGSTAKERAESNRRVAKSRAIREMSNDIVTEKAQHNCENVTEKALQMFGNVAEIPLQKPQPEKRREEKNLNSKSTAAQVLNTEGAASSKSFEPQKPAEIPPDPSPTALPATPLPDTSHNPSMAGLIAGDLRRRRVLVTSHNPTLLAWVRDGIFLPQLVEAVEIARLRLGEECEIKAGYIDSIVRDPKAGKAAEPVDRWWDSQQGIDRKAREVGVRATGSDTYDTLKDKIFAKVKTLKNEARQAA